MMDVIPEEMEENEIDLLRKVTLNKDELKQKMKDIAAANNARRDRMNNEFWYDIEVITSVISSRGHRSALFMFYSHGYAGEDIYPQALFKEDVIKAKNHNLEKRRNMGKVLQLNVLSAY